MLGCSGHNNTSIKIGLSLRYDVPDDESRYAMVFPLRKKSDATKAFQKYCHDIKIECGLDAVITAVSTAMPR